MLRVARLKSLGLCTYMYSFDRWWCATYSYEHCTACSTGVTLPHGSPHADAVVCGTYPHRLNCTEYAQHLCCTTVLHVPQVCDYLTEGDTADTAVDQAHALLGLTALQASQVTAVEAPAVLQLPLKGSGVSRAAGAPGGCGNAVMAAAAAGVAAAVGVALAYLNLGQ